MRYLGWVEGVEPARKRKLNNIEAHGWHKKHCKYVIIGLSDRKLIADFGMRIADDV